MNEQMSCLELLKSHFKNFSAGEKKVAELILNNPENALGMKIGEVAQKSGTSKASVVRLCKRIGYSGYKELCIMLNATISQNVSGRDISRHFYKDIHSGEDIRDIATGVAENNIKSIRSTLACLDTKSLERTVRLLTEAKRIDFYGAGCSALMALDAANKLLRIGRLCFANTDTHMQTVSASSLSKGDVALIFSHSGETNDMLEIARLASKAGATIISVTGSVANSISSLSDVSLHTVSGEGRIRSGAMESRIGMLTVIDMIYSAMTAGCYDTIKDNLDRSTDALRSKKKDTSLLK